MLRKLIMGWAAGALVLGATACGDSSTEPRDPTELEFDPVTGVVLSEMNQTATGLYWQDLVEGTGAEAVAGDSITVHYTLWLHDGTEIESTAGGTPVTFSLAGLIPGWQEGVPGMKVGGMRKLVIPPALGYGSKEVGDIPRNSTLVFDIELVGVG